MAVWVVTCLLLLLGNVPFAMAKQAGQATVVEAPEERALQTQSVPECSDIWLLTQPLDLNLPAYANVREAVLQGHWKTALKSLDSIDMGSVEERYRPFLALVRGILLDKLERGKEAAEALAVLEGQTCFLEPWRLYFEGWAHYSDGRFDVAASLWSRIPDDAAARGTLGRPLCRALGASGNAQGLLDCVANLRRMGIRDDKLWLEAVVQLVALGRQEEACDWAREIVVHHPTSHTAREALLVQKQIAKTASCRTELSDSESIERLEVLFAAHKYGRILDETSAIRKAHKSWDTMRCQATAYRALSLNRRREETRSLEFFDEAVDHCPDLLTASFLYRGTESAYKAQKPDFALKWARLLAQNHPGSNLCDDGLLFAARALKMSHRDKERALVLRQIIEDFPSGDMTPDAAWMELWPLIEAGKFRQASKEALAFDSKLPQRGDYRWEGRLLYWVGRCEELQGHGKKARAAYRSVIERHPLGWYTLLAVLRLEASRKGLGQKAVAKAVENSCPVLPTLEQVKEWGGSQPGVEAGQTLLALGFADEAAREFDAALDPGDKDVKALLWRAWLYHTSGDYSASHQLLRRRVPQFADTYPTPQDPRWWDIAYPPAYGEIIRKECKAQDVAWSLAQAITREESGFSACIESYAHAMGLMQLLVKTGSHMAGRDLSKRDLCDPRLNVQLGVKYVRYLLDRFHHPVLAAAGYNSGPGGVLKTFGRTRGREVDAFVESIPYDQTRRYTKRVLSSAWRYQMLYTSDHPLFEMPLRYPKAEKKKKKKGGKSRR